MTGIYPERKRWNQNRALSVSAGSSRPNRRDLNNTRYAKHAILFMQNEPNFKNTKMNINCYKKSVYKDIHCEGSVKNEPKRTQFRSHSATIHLFMQNKPNLQGGRMNINSYKTSNYEEKHLAGNSKNKPKQTQFFQKLLISLILRFDQRLPIVYTTLFYRFTELLIFFQGPDKCLNKKPIRA